MKKYMMAAMIVFSTMASAMAQFDNHTLLITDISSLANTPSLFPLFYQIQT